MGELTIIGIKSIGALGVRREESFLFGEDMNFLGGGGIGGVFAYDIGGRDGKGHSILILFIDNLTGSSNLPADSS